MKASTLFVAVCLNACSTITPPNPSPIGQPPPTLILTSTGVSTSLPSSTGVVPTPTNTEPPPTPTITSTPLPSLTQLTSGGCCPQPFFSPDASQVWYLDHPAPDSPAGIWGVPLTGGSPQFISDRPGYFSADGQYIVYPKNFHTYIQNTVTGERWEPPLTEGRFVAISPNNAFIAWQVNSSVFNFDGRAVDIWVANLNGSSPYQVAHLLGGGLNTWFPDSQRLLVTNRDFAGADPQLTILNIVDGSLTPLVQAFNLRGVSLSPQGGWIVYQIAFSGDPTRDGLWIISSDGTQNTRLDVFGSYRWRSETQLLIVPLNTTNVSASQQLLQFDITTSTLQPVTHPDVTPFRIANGDWIVSPNGSQVVFLSADDRNLWLLQLP